MKEKEMRRKKEEERKEEPEKKIVQILTDEKVSAIKAMLEKDHTIDCIFLLMLGKGQWKHSKEFMKKLDLTLPDGTFRSRMKEIEYNGLARHENIGGPKKRWVVTEFGQHVGKILLDFFGKIDSGESV